MFELAPADLWPLRSFEVKGTPLAVAVLGRRILVGNTHTHRVEFYDRTGRLLGSLGGGFFFGQPNDIAADRKLGLVVVVDCTGAKVELFDMTQAPWGVPVLTLPPGGPDPSVLARPAGVALDRARGEILVSDFGATEQSIKPRIQVFGLDGTLRATLPAKKGTFGYRFYRPQGMTLDPAGRIFVTDSFLGRVLVLDRDTGDTIAVFGSFGTAPGQLSLPLDASIAGDPERLFVTNHRAGRIEVFSLEGMP